MWLALPHFLISQFANSLISLPLFRHHIPPLKVASNSWVCVKGEVCHLSQLVPLRGFGGLPNKRLATVPLLKGARGMLSPSAYGLRPSVSSSFFRLETPFLPFFTSLYYIISQLFIYPSYTNRPRFV